MHRERVKRTLIYDRARVRDIVGIDRQTPAILFNPDLQIEQIIVVVFVVSAVRGVVGIEGPQNVAGKDPLDLDTN